MKFRKIESERLDIYMLSAEDVKAFYLAEPKEVAKNFFGISNDSTYEKDKSKYEVGVTTYRTQVMRFVLRDRLLDATVGECAFHNWYPVHRRAEIGYAICSDTYKQKGYMSEAVQRIIRFGFEELDLNRIEAFVGPDNLASLGVVRKNGFTKEAHLRQHFNVNGELTDSLVFALLRERWLSGDFAGEF